MNFEPKFPQTPFLPSTFVVFNFADLLVCVNKNTLEAVDISKNFPPLYQGKSIEANTLTKNDPNLMVFAFTAGNTKEYSTDYRNKCEDVPIGHLAQKIEQLELLGFLPIVVIFQFIALSYLIRLFLTRYFFLPMLGSDSLLGRKKSRRHIT